MPFAAATPCRAPGCSALVKPAGYCDLHRSEQHKVYNEKRKALDLETDKLYHTARWRRLRAEVLAAEPACRMCKADGYLRAAVLVDHIQPVKQGGPFWSRGNLQPLCNNCHEAKSRAEGSRFFKPGAPKLKHTSAEILASAYAAAKMPGMVLPPWLPAPTVPVVVVCGPPGCGKSSYVHLHAAPADLVLDPDVIASTITGKPLYHTSQAEAFLALSARNRLLAALGDADPPWPRGWLIVTAGRHEARTFWQRRYPDFRLLPFDRAACVAAVRKDPRRPPASIPSVVNAILDWH